MLGLACAVLGAAVLLGAALSVAVMRRKPAPASVAHAHAAVALAGLALLIEALRGAARGAASGTQMFGAISAASLGLAAILGIVFLALRLRRRALPGALIAVHAGVAIWGFVLLVAYVALP